MKATNMTFEEKYDVKKGLETIWIYLLGLVIFYILIVMFLQNPFFISGLGTIVTVSAFFTFLMIESIKNEKQRFERKNQLTIYKRNLLFKLEGTLSIINWTLSSYLTLKVSMMYSTTKKIQNMSVQKFQESQFNSYKIYYDEIKYFTTSEIVPMHIKEKLDLLNLDAEKLINFLPLTEGKLNKEIYEHYLYKILYVVKWTIYDEYSEDVLHSIKGVLEWIDKLFELQKLEN